MKLSLVEAIKIVRFKYLDAHLLEVANLSIKNKKKWYQIRTDHKVSCIGQGKTKSKAWKSALAFIMED